jgi:DNA-directed RNA polymerase specialized sigma24 family protein
MPNDLKRPGRPPAEPFVLTKQDREERVGKLSNCFQQALLAVHVSSNSYTEAAQQLGIPQGTVKSRVYRARKAVIRMREAEQAAG